MKRLRTSLLVFLVLTTALPFLSVPGVFGLITMPWTSDMDESDFSDWDYVEHAEQISDPVYHGDYAANATTHEFWLLVDHADTNPIYCRFYVRFKNLDEDGMPINRYIFATETESEEYIWISLYDDGEGHTVLWYFSSILWDGDVGSTPIVSDTWYEIQIKAEVSAACDCRLWLDGDLECQFTGDNHGTEGFNHTSLFSTGCGVDYDASYFDLVTIDDEFIQSGPSNVGVTITNMEGCGNWVFAEHRYYHFEAIYAHSDAAGNASEYLDHCQLCFEDGEAWIGLDYDVQEEEFNLLAVDMEIVEPKVNLKAGSVTESGQNLIVVFDVFFEVEILDALDVDILMRCNDTTGADTDWNEKQTDYFKIYNLGGQTLGEFATSGNAGRIAGGDVFDFYAYSNNSWVEANVTFRNLQHVKLLPEIWFLTDDEYHYSAFALTYGIDYCAENDTEFTSGWSLRIVSEGGAWTPVDRHFNFSVEFYQQDTKIADELCYCYVKRPGDAGNEFMVRLWFDLWFNKINASSTFGCRVNAYEYPIRNDVDPWLAAFIGAWGYDDTKEIRRMAFKDLLNQSGTGTLSTTQIKLVKLKAKLQVWESASGYQQYVRVQNYDVFDLTFSPKGQPFEGIPTPPWDETKYPTVEQHGLIGTLFSALAWLGNTLANAFGPAILSFWSMFVGFLDSIAAYFGAPKFFTNIFSYIADFISWMSSGLGWIISGLTAGFTFLLETMDSAVSMFVSILQQWVSMAQAFAGIMGSGLNTGYNIWVDFNLDQWIILGAILYFVWLLFLWDEKGLGAVGDHLSFVINVLSAIAHGLLEIAQFAINLIGRIIEAIPVVE